MLAHWLKFQIGVNFKVAWNVRVNDFVPQNLEFVIILKTINSVGKCLFVFNLFFPELTPTHNLFLQNLNCLQ